MRVIVAISLLLALSSAGANAQPGGAKVAFVHGGKLIVLDVASRAQDVVMANAPLGPVAWSGDGKLVSDGGRIAGGPTLPATRLAWAPTGETTAYIAPSGAVVAWTPRGSKTIVGRTWGARSLAWGPNNELALGRKQSPRGKPFAHQEVWIWHAGTLRRVAGPIAKDTTPIVEGFAPDGRVLWWSDEYDSASIAADGLTLYANRTPLATTLVWSDFVAICGTHLAYAAGEDRYTTHGKSIVFDGKDVSKDTTRSWVSPSCNANGMLVAAAGRNWEESRIGKGEHRAIWQLVASRKQLTRPPVGWTDEDPTVLADGSVLFVRTHQTTGTANGQFTSTEHASLDLYANGAVTTLAPLTVTESDSGTWESNYYGHYGWPSLVAVWQ